ncbi:DUF4112 domain-containing protein [Alteromonas sp. ASW11-130]|uniref:DUF4112 domain-containing protein n=1 Tax=Alteromonas sp. ASW11-130 TaxID=3015775 RepID=UPI00224225A7|nr:DUF4112 domain-containing protein [Alteromonas sp. ASW11-130]MCW8090765.1 DUF4112 domain-containing protein [Alteromonas sp. ASW11-130]
MANTLDTAIKVPFIPFKFGLDSIVGLIPGVGDAAMLAASMRIVYLGKKMGMPKSLITKMVRNAALDFGIGFIPFVGDVVDFFYKANRANVKLMEKWWVQENKTQLDANTQKTLASWNEKVY